MWQRLMKEWVGQGNERFTVHDLRAKAVTDLIEDGRKASKLTGHRTESIPVIGTTIEPVENLKR
jgi:integrase